MNAMDDDFDEWDLSESESNPFTVSPDTHEYEEEFASSNIGRDIHALAEKRGCVPVLPGDFEIQLDIDTPEDYELFKLQLQRANEYHFQFGGALAVVANEWTSRSGIGTHVVVRMPYDMDNNERVLWQAILGSDRKRELFNKLRLLKDMKNPITLFRPRAREFPFAAASNIMPGHTEIAPDLRMKLESSMAMLSELEHSLTVYPEAPRPFLYGKGIAQSTEEIRMAVEEAHRRLVQMAGELPQPGQSAVAGPLLSPDSAVDSDVARERSERYTMQHLDWSEVGSNERPHWRITDTTTDSRVATCYVKENAELMVTALNALIRLSKTQLSDALHLYVYGHGAISDTYLNELVEDLDTRRRIGT